MKGVLHFIEADLEGFKDWSEDLSGIETLLADHAEFELFLGERE